MFSKLKERLKYEYQPIVGVKRQLETWGIEKMDLKKTHYKKGLEKKSQHAVLGNNLGIMEE